MGSPIVAPVTTAAAALPSPPPPPPSSSSLVSATDLVDANSSSSPLAEDTDRCLLSDTNRVEHEEETKSGVTETGNRTAIDTIAASSSTSPSSQFWVPSDLGEDGLQLVRSRSSWTHPPLPLPSSRQIRRKDPERREKTPTLKKKALGTGKAGECFKGSLSAEGSSRNVKISIKQRQGFLLSRHERGRSAVLPW